MTSGALIYAINNECFNYLKMAAWSAHNIRRHLNIPVCVATNDITDPLTKQFDRVVKIENTGQPGVRTFADVDINVSWHNASRTSAYDLSPWDNTLLLDADYVVASNKLLTLLDSNQDFLAHNKAYDVTGLDSFNSLNYFGRYKEPMFWATVLFFKKTIRSKHIFDAMEMIKGNWQHYQNLFSYAGRNYRNDYALSIALNIVNGQFGQSRSIPWMLPTTLPEYTLSQLATDEYQVAFDTPNKKLKKLIIYNEDFHAMGKSSLENIIADIS